MAAAFLALALYAAVLVTHVGAVAGGSDSSGYMSHARLLAAGRVHVQPRAIPGLPSVPGEPLLYAPLGFKPAPNGAGLVPTYPAGLSLFILALEPLAGWRHSGDLTMILHALAGLFAMAALLLALGLGRRLVALGVAVLALSPLYLFMSLQAMSDVPSLVWTTLAVLAALRSRGAPGWAVAAGAAMAVDVLLRPTNLLALAPVGIALGASPRRWLLLVLGGLPGAVFFFFHSLAAYGSIAATGYGDSSFAFGLGFVPVTLRHYARWLPVLFTPLVALILGLPWLGRESARTRWLLAAWILVFAAFYSCYQCTHETWWYLRFMLPAAPPLIAGSLLVLRALLSRAPAWCNPASSAAALAVALVLVALFLAWPTRKLGALSVSRDELRYGHVADWMRKNVPAGAVCVAMQASGALFYYTDFTFVRWDAMDPATTGKVEAAARAARRPLYAVLFPFEIAESGVLKRVVPGHWIEVGKVENVAILRRDDDGTKP